MSIATYADLKTQIASWLNRSDLTDAQLAMFVSLAESDIRNDIDTRDNLLLATGTMFGDGFTAPTGYLSTRTLVVGGDLQQYVTPEVFANYSSAGVEDGYYTINGDNFSVLGGNGASYELLYLAVVDALADAGDSNWILANAPEVYLWAGCKYGSAFLKDAEAAKLYGVLYEDAARKLNKRERQSRTGGSLQIKLG
jgi:hypothetical protein